MTLSDLEWPFHASISAVDELLVEIRDIGIQVNCRLLALQFTEVGLLLFVSIFTNTANI